MNPKCKCGGALTREDIPQTPEHEGHIIGRCTVCGKPHYFSTPMWENLVENNS